VTLVERVPAMHAMLREGLERAANHPDLAPIAARMTLILGDAREVLSSLEADVVLVDPMHPPRRKSALVKQRMRTTRALVGDDPDALETLQAALACARARVVLKWPSREPLPTGWPQPSHFIPGTTVRFDVFMMAKGAPAA
jgi:16S rRNA (guanine1516-N2)-methyltransferase